jgi:AAA15 family ATPase/GTPase
MIIEFSVSNYRSIKSEQVLSLIAENTKNKEDNTCEVILANGTPLRLLRSAIIYGANASGKSNIIKAAYTMRLMVLRSRHFNDGDPIDAFNPFLFDTISAQQPTRFALTFIKKAIKYRYEFSFDGKEIAAERLDFYPKGQPANLFKRVKSNSTIKDDIVFGTHLMDKPSEKSVLKNQLYLSLFGGKPHEQLTTIYRYFNVDMAVHNVTHLFRDTLKGDIIEKIAQPEYQAFKNRLAKLIKIADTKIESITSEEGGEDVYKYALKHEQTALMPTDAYAKHLVYDTNGQTVGEKELPMAEESVGTNVLFALGGLILANLETGGIIFFDELDNSLHPKLTKFLIRLFHNPVSNKNNAQLIFASHEVTLLDKEVFRRDQIWFTEKDKYGVTDLYCAKDIEGVREDTAFDKWYMSGKFGGEPRIKEVAFIFGN